MLYAIICIDKPDSIEVRKAHREAHLAHIRNGGAKNGGTVVQAGPFLSASNGEMCGSLIIFESEDIAQAQAWSDADPYQAADLFQSVEIRAWNRVVGN